MRSVDHYGHQFLGHRPFVNHQARLTKVAGNTQCSATTHRVARQEHATHIDSTSQRRFTIRIFCRSKINRPVNKSLLRVMREVTKQLTLVFWRDDDKPLRGQGGGIAGVHAWFRVRSVNKRHDRQVCALNRCPYIDRITVWQGTFVRNDIVRCTQRLNPQTLTAIVGTGWACSSNTGCGHGYWIPIS